MKHSATTSPAASRSDGSAPNSYVKRFPALTPPEDGFEEVFAELDRKHSAKAEAPEAPSA